MLIPALPPELIKPSQSYVYYMEDRDTAYIDTGLSDLFIETYKSVDIRLTYDLMIAKKVNEIGYTVANITESSFIEDEQKFTVYTVEVNQKISDYNELYKQEKQIRKELELYKNNIILELI